MVNRQETPSEQARGGRACGCGNVGPLYQSASTDSDDLLCAECWGEDRGSCGFCANTGPWWDIRRPDLGELHCVACYRPVDVTLKVIVGGMVDVFRPDLPLEGAYVDFGWPAAQPFWHRCGQVVAEDGDRLLVKVGSGEYETVNRSDPVATSFGAESMGSMREAFLGLVDEDDDQALGAVLLRLHQTELGLVPNDDQALAAALVRLHRRDSGVAPGWRELHKQQKEAALRGAWLAGEPIPRSMQAVRPDVALA